MAYPLTNRAARAQTGKVDVVSLLKDLIRFDTVNAPGDTRSVADYLKVLFNQHNIPNEIILAPNGKAAHFIARLKGNGSKRPVLIAAHTDVVPAEAARWSVDPFMGVEKDGFIYGRGALDNKGDVAVFAAAMIALSKARGTRTRDVIFLAEADEEQGQYNTGWLAQNHWDKIDAEFCLNEGGRTRLDPDGVVRELTVSRADKLTLNLRLKTSGPTGHSSRPLPLDQTANGQLITALMKLQAHQTEIVLSEETATYLKASAKVSSPEKAAAINALLAATTPDDKLKASQALLAADQGGWGTEGLLRNTLVITMINSGIKPNVIPGTAEAVMNARLLPGQSVETFIRELEQVIDNQAARFEIISTLPPQETLERFRRRSAIRPSSIDTDLFRAIETSAKATWPKVTVVPTLLVASTDATPWRERGVPVYGIEPMPTDAASTTGIHGDDERVAVASLKAGEAFVTRILKTITAK
ncbi:M20/M25/M40 family metallo-hydrolase [Asticcacaulis machinosus]|uniref:M20/M25/M40 family metallo-hydrolase n=1 Tax=Asticcacaulis machinosus TaxID=2984211 RepID=A0ABT5HMH0_9CAUL|nr:M20/M25/M40 family metallo-hydrolase [Asticcacaulis machinosus]MDC7677449.1 M20/M25/M40 family metallo-hydrolase [Asticcacaulis machinosus]